MSSCCCRVQLFASPKTASRQASLSFTISQSSLKFTSTSWWCYPTISSSAALFSFCLQSFLASGSFPVSQHFASGSQCFGASVLTSVLPMNIQGCFPLGLTGLISLQCKGLSRIFSSTIIRKHEFLMLSLFYGPALTSVHDYWKSHSFDCSFVGKMMSLLFNTASRSS